ncbi:2-succinyl-5-enolpyruvyl-6-hydroxy-3-cyclohexene-1-carboxylic-acid synthase [Rhodocytophaga aerolata]|uniref:2-succinyl-5-enolpyruvyl-6-hydroxy-3-cyclohexene-1-carboxylate synthase n=1 Tax=Rhodocytophaga aerolata TaxID=455078 RepID=A0ABT8R6D6_9BACT|nr:2-succinyl-5-enolpyruvyl-6-hydroxy-3-cyclohexene-1-carboxylic-acid synthase [Rhodocytophaga aerolata]MDO1447660.1 2-succinyl-5-enolpyruvyl-6-hydroxy-3-cyclohexene-1-carboxylic-acid synthase [Rhodocytophaga aerolata]
MAILQPIVNIAEICAQRHVTQCILSPGSRCAPLTLAFVRHLQIHTRTIPDERSAAFIALGMASQSRQTVVLVCTSGTAVLNYAPAITEAYYQQVPLLVLTADRPSEWIEQQDGQTIRQREVYGKHVKASFELPVAFTHPDAEWHTYRIINEALTIAQTYPFGPVHINVPLREPLYPSAGEEVVFDKTVRIIQPFKPEQILTVDQWIQIREQWEDADRKLIVAGQYPYQAPLAHVLKQLQTELEVPIIADIISNLHTLPDVIRYQDMLLMQKNTELLENLKPDLLITFGNSVISKNVKLFLRKHKPSIHWHIQPAGIPADPFQSLTHVLPVEPLYFFKTLFEDLDYQHFLSNDEPEYGTDYYALWQKENQKAAKVYSSLFSSASFSEFEAVSEMMDRLPDESILHLANSMPVRYANFISLQAGQTVEVFANRGTSGIDGSNGTALGAALTTEKLVILLTGDMAFLYDRNSLWHNYLPKNLRIIVLNNHGGGIFRLLDGPAGQPELEEYFETRQRNTAELTAKDAGMLYSYCNSREQLGKQLTAFFDLSGGAKLLEIETDPAVNAEVYARFKQYFTT